MTFTTITTTNRFSSRHPSKHISRINVTRTVNHLLYFISHLTSVYFIVQTIFYSVMIIKESKIQKRYRAIYVQNFNQTGKIKRSYGIINFVCESLNLLGCDLSKLSKLCQTFKQTV